MTAAIMEVYVGTSLTFLSVLCIVKPVLETVEMQLNRTLC